MRKSLFVIAAALLAANPARALAPSAQAARLNVGADRFVVGGKTDNAGELLDCAKSEVQHTILQCSLKPAALTSASSVGRRVQGAALTLNFKGEIINMSLTFDAGLAFDVLLSDYKLALEASPKVQYWADDKHLFESYIWIDGATEVELTRPLKGPAQEGAVRVYISSLSGDQDLSPEDAR
jgi:hypothetical protein